MRCSPTIAFPNSCGRSAWRRARAASPWCSTPTDRRRCRDDLFRIATHVVFSSECLRATTGLDDLGAALARIADTTPSFLAVTRWPAGRALARGTRRCEQARSSRSRRSTRSARAMCSTAPSRSRSRRVATSTAAMRFAAAAAGLKCTRLGGSAGGAAARRGRSPAGAHSATAPRTRDLADSPCGRIVF